MTTDYKTALARAKGTQNAPPILRAKKLAHDHYAFAAALAARRAPPEYLTECMSEALYALVQAAQRYPKDCVTSFCTFAYPAIEGAVLKYLRRARRRERAIMLYAPADLETLAPRLDATTEEERRSAIRGIDDATFAMDDYERALFELRFMGGATWDEVVAQLGPSCSAVRRRAAVMKQRLREAVTESTKGRGSNRGAKDRK